MRIAITGGRGRLVSVLAASLARDPFDVALFSRRPSAKYHAISRLGQCLDNFDILIHCAWSTVPLTAEQNPRSATEVDIPLLQGLLAAGRPLAKKPLFIFLSTAAVYGNTSEFPATEAALLNPVGRYAFGKTGAENVLKEESAKSGWPVTILRPANLLGLPSSPLRHQGVLPGLIRSALSGEPITIWGDGTNVKDYLDCSDFAEAVIRVMAKGLTGTFNVSAQRSVDLLHLVRLVEAATGCAVPLQFSEPYPWDIFLSRVSSERIRKETGWTPKLSLEDSVGNCVREERLWATGPGQSRVFAGDTGR